MQPDLFNASNLTREDKRPLLLLSGGLDSTYLAYLLLQETNIDVLYIKAPIVEEKIKAEKKALEKIYAYLNKHCKFKIIRKYEQDVSGVQIGASSRAFAQPNLWLFGALNILEKEHSDVFISYVSGDQIASCIDRLHSAWEHLVYVTKTTEHDLIFPFRFVSKQFILNRIPKALQKLTWTCEDPKVMKNKSYRKCGTCVPCVTSKINLLMKEELEKIESRKCAKLGLTKLKG
jgi:7-cyano-7-deazaguanine synthase in queuosine biosynthesis